jgi:hypothetical protein
MTMSRMGIMGSFWVPPLSVSLDGFVIALPD